MLAYAPRRTTATAPPAPCSSSPPAMSSRSRSSSPRAANSADISRRTRPTSCSSRPSSRRRRRRPAPDPATPRASTQSTIDRLPVIVPIPGPTIEPLAVGPTVTTSDPVVGPAIVPQPLPASPARPRGRPQGGALRHPRRSRPPALSRIEAPAEEEASLRLSLTIDARGRVTAVSPVGPADPAFLDAARRHIVRHWRYSPASEDGAAIASTIVVTLTFTLEE